MAGASARASMIGAWRLTCSARSICSGVYSSSGPLAGSAALATSTSIERRLGDQALDRLRLPEVARQRAASDLGRQRLEHVGPAAGQHQIGPTVRERAGNRVPDPARGAGQEHVPADETHAAGV